MPRLARNKAELALLAFVECIETTGGIVNGGKGYMVPVADREWVDLGAAYLVACDALNIEPVVLDEENLSGKPAE